MGDEFIPVSDIPIASGDNWSTMDIQEYVRLGTRSEIRDLRVEMDEEDVVINGISNDLSCLHASRTAEAWLAERGLRRRIINVIIRG